MNNNQLLQIQERQEMRRDTMEVVRPTPEDFKEAVRDCDAVLSILSAAERTANLETMASRGATDYTIELEQENAALREQLADAQQTARDLATIVRVGTGDDPGTTVIELRKLQSVAATTMRDLCVEKLRGLLEREVNGHSRGAYQRAIIEIQSLTLEQEQK